MPITALGLSPAALGALTAPAGEDPVLAAARAAAASALSSVAARARTVAADVAVETAARQHLLGVDWHGAAASAFTARVEDQHDQLRRLQLHIDDLAARAEAAAQHLAGGVTW